MPSPSDPVAGLPAPGLHQGRQTCTALLRQVLTTLAPRTDPAASDAASLSPTREVWLIDRQFNDWPLDDPLILAALGAWLRQGGRRLQVMGVDFDATARALPRFARWRRDWSHAIDVHRPVDGLLPPALRGLWAGSVRMQWLDAPDWRMQVFTDSVQVRSFRTELADFLQRCEPAWPCTTLGL